LAYPIEMVVTLTIVLHYRAACDDTVKLSDIENPSLVQESRLYLLLQAPKFVTMAARVHLRYILMTPLNCVLRDLENFLFGARNSGLSLL